VEGFVVLASRHPKSDFFCKQGTPLASEFLNMYTGADDPLGDFHTWVAGKAIEKAKKPELQAKSHVKYKKAVVPAHEWDEGTSRQHCYLTAAWLTLSVLLFGSTSRTPNSKCRINPPLA
jgi:hypothetical protein